MRKNQFLIVGVGRFGTAVATNLYRLGHEVVVVDTNQERVEDIMSQVTHAVVADATEEATLKNLGIGNFDCVIVAIGENFKANVLTTVLAKSFGVKQVISKAADDLSAQVLSKVGADQVVLPEHDSGARLARKLCNPTMVGSFDLGPKHEVIEIEAPDRLRGNLIKLDLTNRFGVQVIAVSRDGALEVSPRADVEIAPGDKVVLIGSNEAIERLRRHLSG